MNERKYIGRGRRRNRQTCKHGSEKGMKGGRERRIKNKRKDKVKPRDNVEPEKENVALSFCHFHDEKTKKKICRN